MAPFRSGGRLNRSGRTQTEHDLLEGLPIRQWRVGDNLIGSTPQGQSKLNKNEFPELPMPRDSHMLPEHSQQLLRAARAGRLMKSPHAAHDDEKENAEEDEEAKEPQTGFIARKFIKVPRHLEEPEPEYLAKRRKGLPSAYSAYNAMSSSVANAGNFRKTKVKQIDTDGNVNIYEVLVPEGQRVAGEIRPEETMVTDQPPSSAPGTIIEGVGVVNADGFVVAGGDLAQQASRRKPQPPKRRRKPGPGRGKKKVVFSGEASSLRTSSNAVISSDHEASGIPSIKTEGQGDPMDTSADGTAADNHEGDDDESEEEDGSDGEDGDDDADRGDGETSLSPEKPPIEPENVQPRTDEATTSAQTKNNSTLPIQSISEAPQPILDNLPQKASPETKIEPSTTDLLRIPESNMSAELLSNPFGLPSTTPSSQSQESPLNQTVIMVDIPVEESLPLPAPTSNTIASEGEQPTENEPDLLSSLEKQLEQDSKGTKE